MLLEGFLLAIVAGRFSKQKKTNVTPTTPTNILQNHINDLKNYVFRPLDLKQSTFEKLEAISSRINKNVVETNESIIEALYSELIASGDIKRQQ